ncbi:MAG: hypothetical protein GY953_39170, partial [bacterium]|nr:hypothetical protein [bacterium]
MGTEWAQLDSELVRKLSEALLQCHHAAQYIPRVARAYVPSRPDDSHNTLQWETLRNLLVSEAVPTPQGEFRLGLRLRDLTLVVGEEFPLS